MSSASATSARCGQCRRWLSVRERRAPRARAQTSALARPHETAVPPPLLDPSPLPHTERECARAHTVKRVRVVLGERREVAALARSRARRGAAASGGARARASGSGARRHRRGKRGLGRGGGGRGACGAARPARAWIAGMSSFRARRRLIRWMFCELQPPLIVSEVALRSATEGGAARSGARGASREAGARARARRQRAVALLEHVQERELRVMHARGPAAHWPQHPLQSEGGGARVRPAHAASTARRHLSRVLNHGHGSGCDVRMTAFLRPALTLATSSGVALHLGAAPLEAKSSLPTLVSPPLFGRGLLLPDYHQTSLSGRWTTTTPSEIAARSMR